MAEIQQVGDMIVTPASSYAGRESLPFPQNANDIARIPAHHTPADYFW